MPALRVFGETQPRKQTPRPAASRLFASAQVAPPAIPKRRTRAASPETVALLRHFLDRWGFRATGRRGVAPWHPEPTRSRPAVQACCPDQAPVDRGNWTGPDQAELSCIGLVKTKIIDISSCFVLLLGVAPAASRSRRPRDTAATRRYKLTLC